MAEIVGRRYAAVEGGGTSWSVAIMVDSPDNIVERVSFPTEEPARTIGWIRDWYILKDFVRFHDLIVRISRLRERQFDAIGVATFGPVDAKPSSQKYGFITSTPKPGNFVDKVCVNVSKSC